MWPLLTTPNGISISSAVFARRGRCHILIICVTLRHPIFRKVCPFTVTIYAVTNIMCMTRTWTTWMEVEDMHAAKSRG